MNSSNPKKVVLSPEIVVLGILNAKCRQVLTLWKRGLIRPIVSPYLLVVYGKLFTQMGFSHALIREWLIWFSRSLIDPSESKYEPCETLDDVLIQAMVVGEAESVVTSKARTLSSAGIEIKSTIPDAILAQCR